MGKTSTRAGRGGSKAAIIGGVFASALLALMIYASLGLRKYSCDVCITFGRQTACRKADGSSREEALRTATDAACAMLASGMTDSLQCSRTTPKSQSCR